MRREGRKRDYVRKQKSCGMSSVLSSKEKCHLVRVKRREVGLGDGKLGKSGKWGRLRLATLRNGR